LTITDDFVQKKVLSRIAPEQIDDPVLLNFFVSKELPKEDREKIEEFSKFSMLTKSISFDEIFTKILRIQPESKRVKALEKIVPQVPIFLLPEIFKIMISISSDELRSAAVESLAPYMSEGFLVEAFNISSQLGEPSERARAYANLAPYLTAISKPTLYNMWQEILPISSKQNRQDTLFLLEATIPIIHTLGSEEAITDTFQAVQDVGRWWP
jgi:hypothetical protein